MSALPASVDEVTAGLRAAGYLPGGSTALVSYLAARLGKPVLVEGPAGVGKTELAKALSRYLDRKLVRLQCYEGLDEAKALYEWNYRKQLLRIQAEADGTGWDAVQDDIFGEEFLLSRPLMQAIASEEPVVLLIDEIDKTDQEFEAMLLELLSDFQISIPELGRIEARTHPVVLLTSNNTRELTEALKRRCLYLWLDYPTTEHELEIVRLHAPELSETVATQAREHHPAGARPRPQEAALDRGVDRLGARAAAARRRRHLARDLPRDDVDHRQAPHRPRHGRRARRRAARRARGVVSTGFDARVVELGEALRAEGVAIGTSELNDAFAALAEVPWTAAADFRGTLAATLAKSPEDRRIFDLVFDRFFFRATEAEAIRQGVREGGIQDDGEDGITGGDRIELDNLREQLLQAIRDGNDAAMRDLARLAIAAFGRRGEGSGVLGVDVQRIRRALGLRSEPGGPVQDAGPPEPRLTREQIRRFEQHLRRELERAQIERTQSLPPSRPLTELDRALPTGPLQDLAAVHRVVAQLKRRLATQGPGDARAQAPRARRRAAHDARVAPDRRRARGAEVPPAPAAAAGAVRAVRRLDVGHQRVRVLPQRAARAARHVPEDALVRVRRADLGGHRRVRPRALVPRGLGGDLEGRRRRRRLRLHRLRPRLERVPRAGRGRPAPARDRDRARRRPHQRPRPARGRLRA